MNFPIKVDCQNLRRERQKMNNINMFHALITQDQVLVKQLCNNKELDRVLEELSVFQFSLSDLLRKCSVDYIYAMTLAGRLSKVASRQANIDEAYILDVCNKTVSQVGITIKNLSPSAFRPTKDGRILSKTQYEKSGLKKSDCLKSFDAQITGKIPWFPGNKMVNGWVFAKVAYGSGGHQDNVFAEAHEFGEWVKKFGKKDELHVMLIDTDQVSQFCELRDKFSQPNILVCNHFDLQVLFFYWGLIVNQFEFLKKIFYLL